MPYIHGYERERLMSEYYSVSKKKVDIRQDCDWRGYTLDTPRRRREKQEPERWT